MRTSFFRQLPIEAQIRLDAICVEYESAWRRGEPAALEVALAGGPASYRLPLLRELICLDVALRREAGQAPPAADYQGAFPEHATWIADLSCFHESPEEEAGGGASADGDLDDKTRVAPLEQTRRDEESLPGVPGGGRIGSYRLLELLGRGGMGEVYRASHELIDCQRAVKTLRASLAAHPLAVRRFLREAQASVQHLNHPNLVAVYDVSREGDAVFLVMELLDGEDLARLVDRRGPLPPREAVEIILQAAEGLQFAHERGFIHRDIKPPNVMLTRDGRVKILDLGLVRALDAPEREPAGDAAPPAARPDAGEPPDLQQTMTVWRSRLTEERTILGTLPYMSPEQVLHPEQADAQCDIYSLGCTLYFLLTGRHAFSGETLEDVIDKLQRGVYPPLDSLRDDIPPALAAIVERMLHASREVRFANALEVQTALQSWLEQGASRIRVQSAEELKRGLVGLGLISEDDWRTAAERARRPSRAWSTEAGPPPSTLSSPPLEQEHPVLILQKLRELQDGRGGQKYGLSEFQVRMVLQENADLLRLRDHVLLDQIGDGWKGGIYKARQLTANRTETLRLLPLHRLEGLGPAAQQRPRRLTERAPKLLAVVHPSLAKVYSCEPLEHRVLGSTVCLAGEFLVGQSLEEYVATRRAETASRPTAEWLLRQWVGLARGLHQAHQAGLLHRDITARSLRVEREQSLRLTDLGVAELLLPGQFELPRPSAAWRKRRAEAEPVQASLRDTDACFAEQPAAPPARELSPSGTPEIQAPELLRNPRDATPASDLYSCGCCLFFCLTGQYPFLVDSASGLALGALDSSPWDSPRGERVPPSLKPLLDRLLAPQPSERFASALDFAEAMEVLLRTKAAALNVPVDWTTDAKSPPSQDSSWWRRLWTAFGEPRG